MTNVIMLFMEFGDWLSEELKNRRLTQSELSIRAGVSQGAIAHIIAGRRNAGAEVCEGIARALRLPPEIVFRKAGLLPPARDENPTDEELLHLFDKLDEGEQEDILNWIRLKVEQNERKG